MKSKHLCISLTLGLGLALALALLWALGSRSVPAQAAPPAVLTAQDEVTLQVVAQVGGSVTRISVQENYAYVGTGPRMIVLDVSNPAHPVQVGATEMLSGSVSALHVVGEYAYAEAAENLLVFSVADPIHPVLVGMVEFSEYTAARDLFVTDGYAYLMGPSVLRIISVADPAHPVEMGSYWGAGGSFEQVQVIGDYAYLAGAPEGALYSGLLVVSVADKNNPSQAGFVQTSEGVPYGLHVAGDTAYVASTSGLLLMEGHLEVFSVANPANPTLVRSYSLSPIQDGHSWAVGVYVSGDYAYVSADYGGLVVISVADPANPVELGITDTPGRAKRAQVVGDHAYVADSGGGMRVISVADKNNPLEVGAYDTVVADSIHVADGYAYVTSGYDGFAVISVADPANPVPVGHAWLSGGHDYAKDVYVSGDYAYMADGLSGFKVFSVADKANPVLLGECCQVAQGAQSVFVAGDYAYLATSNEYLVYPDDYPSSLRVISVADPYNPSLVGSYLTPGYAEAVHVAGDYAYVAMEIDMTGPNPGRLQAVSVTDPANPTPLGFYESTVFGPGDVQVVDDYAYLAGGEGLCVFSLADPTSPTLVANEWGGATRLSIAGEYAFLTARAGVRMISVADPNSPYEVGAFDTPVSERDVDVVGDYVYVAAGDGGLVVMKIVPLTLQVSPPAVTFLADVDEGDPAPRTLGVESTGRALTWTATLSPIVSWLEVTPLDGTTPAAITATAHISGLVVGPYTTTLVITSPLVSAPQQVPVTLRVAEEIFDVYLPLVMKP